MSARIHCKRQGWIVVPSLGRAGGLAVTRESPVSSFVVTHLESGWFTGKFFSDKREAVLFMRILAPLADWTVTRQTILKHRKAYWAAHQLALEILEAVSP